MDNAPIKHTCPIIDEVINYMNEAQSECDYIAKNIDSFQAEDFIDEINNSSHALYLAISKIEEVREANATLRDWGNELHDSKEKLEEENYQIKSENENLKEELDDLRLRI